MREREEREGERVVERQGKGLSMVAPINHANRLNAFATELGARLYTMGHRVKFLKSLQVMLYDLILHGSY